MRSRGTPRPWTTTKAPSFLAPSFAFLEKNTSCFHMTLTDDIWTNREMLSSLDVFAEWSRITLTHITADWRLQRNQTLQTSWRNYTHHPPKAECLCIFKNLEAKKILHIELSRRRCCCARKRGTLNGGYAHATSASFGPQRRDRATKQRAGNRHVNKKKHTHAHARSYSKYTHKVGTYQVVYSQRLWAQDVYQLPPDSCVGWPAVNCVSDSPLLLLIVSISVPAEKWGCCGQTQSYWSLRLVPDLPAARRGRDGRKKKKKGGRVEPPWHSQTQRLPPGRGNWRCSGEFSLFQVAALYFKMIQLRPFVHLNSDNCFFFPLFFQRHKELSLVCWLWRTPRTIYSGCWLYYGFVFMFVLRATM